MARTFSDEEVEAIARQIVEKVGDLLKTSLPPAVLHLGDAMKMAGFGSKSAFHEWARSVGLKAMRGAKGRYSIDSLRAAIERASRRR